MTHKNITHVPSLMGDSILFGFCPRVIAVQVQVQPESESESECDSVRVGEKPVALL